MMIIRKASKKDFPAIRNLIRAHPKQLMQVHLPKAEDFFVAIEGGKIVGCCALETYSKRLAEVRSLAVSKNFQRRGIATKLIQECLESAKKKKIYELLSITSATALFKKSGFYTFNKERFALIKILQN